MERGLLKSCDFSLFLFSPHGDLLHRVDTMHKMTVLWEQTVTGRMTGGGIKKEVFFLCDVSAPGWPWKGWGRVRKGGRYSDATELDRNLQVITRRG